MSEFIERSEFDSAQGTSWVRRWLMNLTVLVFALAISGSAATAAPILENDFSNFASDFFSNVNMSVVSQNTNSVELEGLTPSTTAFAVLLDFGMLPAEGAALTLTLLDSPGASGRATVTYFSASNATLGSEFVLDSLFAGDNVGIFGQSAPVGATKFRVNLQLLNTTSATYDNLRVDAVPEPGTATLLGLGLLGLAVFRKKALGRSRLG